MKFGQVWLRSWVKWCKLTPPATACPHGKSRESPTRQRTCCVGAGGTATQRAWRIAWAACASAARPTSAGRGLTRSNSPGRFWLEDHWDSDRSSRSSSFSSPISNSSALWSWRRESRIVRVEGRRAYNDPERQLVRCRPNCRQTNPHSDRHQRPSTRCRRHTCPHPKQRFCPDTEEVTGSNPVSPTSNIPNQPPVCDRGHAGGAEIG
jgi:hypothetical protein